MKYYCTWFGGSLLNASSCFQEVGGGRGGGDEGECAVRLWVWHVQGSLFSICTIQLLETDLH